MPFFIVRVVLHHGTGFDYERLHQKMEKQGFSRKIQLGGRWLHLPVAEYRIEGEELNPQTVLDKAKAAAGEVNRDSSILSLQVMSGSQDGLKPV